MKLSEAILLGSTLRPQARGCLYGMKRLWGLFASSVPTSCALGAAYEAEGIRPTTMHVRQGLPFRGNQHGSGQAEIYAPPTDWLPVFYLEVSCPQCERTDMLYRMIPHLNDDHRWTRVEIADFVDTIERRTQDSPQQRFIDLGNALKPAAIERTTKGGSDLDKA